MPQGIPEKEDFRIAASGRCSFLPRHNHVASSAGSPTVPYPCTAVLFLVSRSTFPFSVSALLITQPALPCPSGLTVSAYPDPYRTRKLPGGASGGQQQHENAARDKDWIGR